MKNSLKATARNRIALTAETAAELMMPNPISIPAEASLREALGLLIDRGFSAAPVIDEAGRPVGVLSQTDLLVHTREQVRGSGAEFYSETDLTSPLGEKLSDGFQVECVDPTRVRDVMTPAVFAVAPHTPASRVVQEMLDLKVHRLFVVDTDGILIGVISALDVLRHL
jgi:CBS domain-containing protein